MATRRTLCYLLIAGIGLSAVRTAVAQSGPVLVPGVSEPPEMRGSPKSFTEPSTADTAFWDVLKQAGKGFTDVNLLQLDKFIVDYPTYASAYYWRANAVACGIKPPNLVRAKADLQAALSHKGDGLSMFEEREVLSLLSKIAVSEGQPTAALDLLERAMRADLGSADKIFNIQGVVPEKTSDFCTWNLADLSALSSSVSKDWRPLALMGLYYQFFTTFNESYYPQAAAAFQKAALANARTAVVPYLQGELQVKSAFWTKKAWASDAARDDIYRGALPLFTKAIQIDPGFESAYAARAEVYLQLKKDTLAIKDFDKVLSLQPDNSTAHSDRGIAQSDLGHFYYAISDFSDAIRTKQEGDSYISTLYANRADTYVKVRDYRHAIDDYSSALEFRLEDQVMVLSLAQFRGIYPEYGSVLDDVLLQKLNRRFAPRYEPAAFKKLLTQENGKFGVTFLLSELYESRGDTYLKSGDYKRGILDFQRIYGGIPGHVDSILRWRALGTFGHGDNYYLDVKSSDVLTARPPRIWVKRVGAKQSEVMAFELDCESRKLRLDSSVLYDSNNNTVGRSEVTGWSDVAPDTLGEQLWTGACASTP